MYEIPKELKSLYKHWEKHVAPSIKQTNRAFDNKLFLKEIEMFATLNNETVIWGLL